MTYYIDDIIEKFVEQHRNFIQKVFDQGMKQGREQVNHEGLHLHNAYLRLRQLIPGAFETPTGPTPEQVWKTTEEALKALRKKAGLDNE